MRGLGVVEGVREGAAGRGGRGVSFYSGAGKGFLGEKEGGKGC